MTKPSNRTIPKARHAANVEAVRTAYRENAEKIATMLTDLSKRLEKHRTRFDGVLDDGRTDWGYVGDLGHVATVLTGIAEFLPKE